MTNTPAAAAAVAAIADPARGVVVSMYVKQEKIYARAVSGWFAAWRWALVWGTQLLFYGLPWLQWNGRQAVLFDLGARRFYIFDLVLYPQDFIYLTGLLVVSAYALFLFTAVAGRLWCGFACPQTVYTEIFMAVERFFEGDRMRRMKLDAAPYAGKVGVEKLLRKGGKQLVWLAIGLWTGFSFVGYFTPIQELLGLSLQAALGPWEAFWVLFYGFATYGNAGYLREQVCKYMCPYARFQSAMFDKDTLIISYDTQRGEPRGLNLQRGRKADRAERAERAETTVPPRGDCIDCKLCVQVCPTGIDIRKGLQYECIGCAACIDVCNGVMDKMQTPRGLIRYDTQNGLQQLGRWALLRRIFRPRVLVYSAVLLLISGGLVASLALRSSVKLDVVRDRGALARVVGEGWVENVYRLQLMNTTEDTQRLHIQALGLPGMVVVAPAVVVLEPAAARWVPVAVRIPPQAAAEAGAGSHVVHFVVQRLAGQAPIDAVRENSTFMVPR